ncbi:Mge2 [Symbiodinium sp. KB8]|nr:Mge2 [Symbiodinium sp. KB8]
MLAARVRAASSRATAAVSRVMQARSVAPAVVVPAATALACLFPAGPISAGHARLAHATAGTDAAAEAAKGEEEDDTTQQASPEDASEGAPAAEVDVAELQKELQELRNTRVRLLAEMENTREIARRDVEKGKTYAIQKFAKELLDVSDNLERAVSAVTPEQMEERDDHLLKNLHFGVLATEKELLKLFENHGITKFGKVGEPFDPNRHDAMFKMPPSDEAAPGTLGQVLQCGYTFKDRILRPAKVGAVADE